MKSMKRTLSTGSSERDWPSRKIGYMRVSTDDQDLLHQEDALKRDGCEVIYSDKKSGKNMQRAGWQKAMLAARPGDVIVVASLDRVSRSLRDLVLLLDDFHTRELELRSLRESIDTTTAVGRMLYQLIGVFAEFERALTAERTRKGIAARRTSGETWGAKPKLTEKQVDKAIEALRARLRDPKAGRSVVELSKRLDVDPVTLRKAVLAKAGEKLWPPGPHSSPHERAAARRAGILKPKTK